MKAHTRYQIILLGDRGTIGVNNLPRVVARQCTSQESNPRPSDHKSDALAVTLPSHLGSLIAARPRIEPTTIWSQVRCPIHYATKPPIILSMLQVWFSIIFVSRYCFVFFVAITSTLSFWHYTCLSNRHVSDGVSDALMKVLRADEVADLVNSRKRWSAHLHPHSANIQNIIRGLAGHRVINETFLTSADFILGCTIFWPWLQQFQRLAKL